MLGKGRGWDKINDRIPKMTEDDEIWGVNDAFLRTPEVAKTFHIHDMEDFLEQEKTHSSTKLTMLRGKEIPEMEFFCTYDWDKMPNAKKYPLEEVVDYFKVCYFGCTPDYMMAYALMKGVKEIFFYGLNMAVKEEYVFEKPSLEFWIGMAKGMGVKVHLQHEHTSLLKTRSGLIYGFLIDQWRADEEEADD